MRPASAWLYVPAIVLLVATASAGAGPDQAEGGGRPYAPGRLIVKYRDLDVSAGDLLARRAPFATSLGDDSLDRVQARLGVRTARPLFAPGGQLGRGRSAAYAERLTSIRARFPGRSARIPPGTIAPDLSQIYALELPAQADVAVAAAELAANPHVEYAHPDYEVRVDLTPNDPLFPQQWGPPIIDAPLAWDTADGTGTVVAVVDTGVDNLHPDIAANIWQNPGEIAGNGIDDDGNGFVDDVRGWDFVAEDPLPEDHHGHGTHVAGIAAATANNGIGVAGIGFGAKVMAVKGLNDAGSGFLSDLAPGIVYAAENGADVINNSWGGGGIDALLVDAIDTATALGAVVVAAAGNDNTLADNHEPAGIRGVIAVGASTQTDTIASFSNHGNVLSVAAPGVSVLSLHAHGASGLGTGGIVQQDYQLLSGTSMAAPHVTGLAAVLLSAMPALQPRQVRWQLELNADQPGYPGFEGEPWNPYFGWGRIDAGRVFDPVPVTTRLGRMPTVFHGIAGAIVPGVATLDVAFTTLDPVSWTMLAPSWLPPSVSGGSGDGSVTFDLDATTLAPGSVSGDVTVDAPGAVDGGGSTPATGHVHRDERVGSMIALAEDLAMLDVRPVVESDGAGSAVVWNEQGYEALVLRHLDGAGTPGSPTVIAQGFPLKFGPVIAFDGRNYLVVWYEVEEEDTGFRSFIKAMRVTARGSPVDATPFLIAELKGSFFEVLRDPLVAFDGVAYTVLWEHHRGEQGDTRVYARRVGTDGSLRGRRAVRLYPDKSGRDPQFVAPAIGCAAGRCLVAWTEFDGETAPDGHYLDKAYALVLEGDTPLDPASTRIMNDAQVVRAIATDGVDFGISAFTRVPCPADGVLEDVPVAARVTRTGVSLDPDGIRIDVPTPDCPQKGPWGIVFDGTDYVVPFTVLTTPGPEDLEFGHYLFAARLGRDGTLRDAEPEGLLLHEQPRIFRASVAATRQDSVVVWNERGADFHDDVRARRVLPHAAGSGYAPAIIGSIGQLTVAEGRDLARAIAAPAGFDPATTVLGASNLPAGAIFDAPTGAFRWRPHGQEAGQYPGVTFSATDATHTASETLTIVVSEAVRSFGGLVRFADGTPLTDVRLQIGGIPREKRIAFADRDGRYRVEGLAPKSYTVKLDPISRKRYRRLGPAVKVLVGAGDAVAADLVVEPK